MMNTPAIKFQLFIGKNLGKSNLGKLLIMGDSHYDYGVEQDAATHTQAVLMDDERLAKIKFFRDVAKVFGKGSFLEMRDDIAFANAIQDFMTLPSDKPTAAQMSAAEHSVKSYLEITDADRLVMFSRRIWEHLFNKEKNWGRYVETLEAGGQKATVWELVVNGRKRYAIGFSHPSTMGWKAADWQALLEIFLSKY